MNAVLISWLGWEGGIKVYTFKRCVLFLDNPSTADQYHQEYNPPVEGSYTGFNKQEKVVPVTDPSNDREQVQQRFVVILTL